MSRHSRRPIQVIQGGQYGSESKGAIAAYLCQRDAVNYAVRTGATNAGHTVYYGGIPYKMQQLPVGWVNPTTRLVLGPGALIDIAILEREIEMINIATGNNVRNRLMIDYRASVHLPEHAEASKIADRHHLIGATGKGCSEALIEKIRARGKRPITMGELYSYDYQLHDTTYMLNAAIDADALVQLEGTQGTLLDLHLGPYPYTTHKPTSPGQWMVEAGLSPSLPTDIWFVVRTMPIRVAGNSGPLPDEVSWHMVAESINYRLMKAGCPPLIASWALAEWLDALRTLAAGEFYREIPEGSDGTDQHLWNTDQRRQFALGISELNAAAWKSLSDQGRAELAKLFELTTVTKKLRRIANLDMNSLHYAAMIARPNKVAVTFMNYLFPQRWCSNERPVEEENRLLDDIGEVCDATVEIINRGPLPEHIVDARRG